MNPDPPIIFLDIDGVMNNQHYWHELMVNKTREEILEEENNQTLEEYKRIHGFDPRCVKLLNELTDNTGAVIVLSSTWRLGTELEDLQQLFKDVGITGKLVGKTPVLRDAMRGNEIYKFMDDNYGPERPEVPYVILDDDSDMLLWQRTKYINVDNYIGLTPNIIYKAQRVLEGKGY